MAVLGIPSSQCSILIFLTATVYIKNESDRCFREIHNKYERYEDFKNEGKEKCRIKFNSDT